MNKTLSRRFSLSIALKAVQVTANFTISAVTIQEDDGSVNLMAMRTGNVELASTVRSGKGD